MVFVKVQGFTFAISFPGGKIDEVGEPLVRSSI